MGGHRATKHSTKFRVPHQHFLSAYDFMQTSSMRITRHDGLNTLSTKLEMHYICLRITHNVISNRTIIACPSLTTLGARGVLSDTTRKTQYPSSCLAAASPRHYRRLLAVSAGSYRHRSHLYYTLSPRRSAASALPLSVNDYVPVSPLKKGLWVVTFVLQTIKRN